MKSYLGLLFFIYLSFSCGEKRADPISNDSSVSLTELKKHVIELSSDEYEGRGAGYQGEKKAALYIAQHFESNGLRPINEVNKNLTDYFTPFNFHTRESSNPWEMLSTQNVVGILKGSQLTDEYIIVGAHHDGQGKIGQADFGRNIDGIVSDSLLATKDTIWNSAVDNAVSISSIIEIIRVLKENDVQIKRSIIFSTFSAEESGLDGSIHFTNNLPVPENQIKAMINLEKLVGDPDAEFLYVSYDSNPIFEEIQINLDSIQSIKLKPFYSGIIADTDHYPFYMQKIPSITIGTGSQINVHTSLDHAQNLDFKQLKNRTNYILKYLIQLANSESTFEFYGNVSKHTGVLGCQATKSELELSEHKVDVAFKVTAVIKNTYGYKSKILPGDLIVAIDNEPLLIPKFHQDLIDIIGEEKQESVTLKIIRNKKMIESILLLK